MQNAERNFIAQYVYVETDSLETLNTLASKLAAELIPIVLQFKPVLIENASIHVRTLPAALMLFVIPMAITKLVATAPLISVEIL